MSEQLLPIFLRLAGRPVLVVGGGPVALAKIDKLVGTGARITVVAPEVLPSIEAAPVTVCKRPFSATDLDGVWLVIAAATASVNQHVEEAASARRIFVNVVDDPVLATAFMGGVVHRDGVTVAVATEGRAPALAGLLREALEHLLPEDLSAWVGTATSLRERWKSSTGERVPMHERRPLLLRALNEMYAKRGAEGGRDPC